MKVTSIKQQVKNPERVSVFVDGKYSFSLNLDELVAQKLKKDMELDEASLKKLKKLSADGKSRARALNWLLIRPHSTRELRDYLRHKKTEPELADKLTREFTDKKYLNDTAYGRWLVELRSRAGKSNRAIRAELFKKGLAHEVIEEVMQEAGDAETDRLKELVAKKQKLSRYANDPLKLTKYLTSQGFDYHSVKGIVAPKGEDS